MTQKKALITGICGQDGSFLAELLLNKDYQVHGIVRRSSSINTSRIDHIFDRLQLHFGDMTDGSSLNSLLSSIQPDEIYNLAAMSHVAVSFETPEYVANVGALGTLRLLEAARAHCPEVCIYNASSSEMYGSSPAPQNEETVFHPRSPYAVAKVFAHNICVNYREAYGMRISNGTLFNHEGPRRGETFVTRKCTLGAARIKLGLQDKLYLGNLQTKRDIGSAQEYVEAMWLMLQHEPDDFVIASGETHTIEEFLQVIFSHVGLKWEDYVERSAKYYRPSDVPVLRGDPSKALRILGWKAKTRWDDLLRQMVDADMKGLKK